MDWLIGSSSDAEADAHAARLLLEEHLQRHATEPPAAEKAQGVLADRLPGIFEAAEGGPVHLMLDWARSTPALTVSRVDEDAEAVETALAAGTLPRAGLVPAAGRAVVRGWARTELATLELPLERRHRQTFPYGPPPGAQVGLDLERQGAGAVAVALVGALEAHPSASAPQAALIAGSMIADVGTRDDQVHDAASAAEAFVSLHRALGSEAHVVSAEGDRIEVAVSSCPFEAGSNGSTALCQVSTGMAGHLGARVNGEARVVLVESVVDGDMECHLQVLLGGPELAEVEGQTHFWPPRASAPVEAVPHLDLSVSLPRESFSVPVVRRLAAQALRAFGVDVPDIDDVQLAITEACANVIDHAADTDTYDVKVELAADRCAITVVDQGAGFDATTVPEQAHQDAEMGRGLTLMRALVDNVAFHNEPQAGAVVHMVKELRYDAGHPLRGSGR